MRWSWELIREYGKVLQTAMSPLQYMESIRSIIRVVSMHEKEIMKMSDENSFSLAFLISQISQITQNNEIDNDITNAIELKFDGSNVLDNSIVSDNVANHIESETIIGIIDMNMSSIEDVGGIEELNNEDMTENPKDVIQLEDLVVENIDTHNNNENNNNSDNDNNNNTSSSSI